MVWMDLVATSIVLARFLGIYLGTEYSKLLIREFSSTEPFVGS